LHFVALRTLGPFIGQYNKSSIHPKIRLGRRRRSLSDQIIGNFPRATREKRGDEKHQS
jgi:hypothetical protein